MGKKNPLKQIVQASQNVLFNPLREVARGVGAEGAVNFFDGAKKVYNDVGNGAIDLANNEKGKQQKKNDIRDGEILKQQNAAAATASAAAAAAENDRIESERMSGGTASRTLLTGPKGLDDEEKSISRRTLAGR